MRRHPLPLMADARPETQPALQPSRIKRNTACTSCRDAKVRCNPSARPDQPCQRCAKLHSNCVVDKTYKRVSRRSKLDELVQEIQSIKQSVESVSAAPSLAQANHAPAQPREPPAQQLGIPSPSCVSSGSRPHTTGTANTTVIESTTPLETPPTTLLHAPSSQPSLPRTLGSYPFSGDDIDYYFQKYFECYHSYMPVVRHRDPNKCYEVCPLLFWTIIYVSSRRYAKSTSLVPFLSEEIRRQVFEALGDVPLTLPTINAIILICSWIFPRVRIINDPSSMLSNAIINAALLLGIHTGRGGHPEYSHGAFQNNYTDEEATYTWAGLNIISQRVSSYLGLPPIGPLFNQTIQNTIDGRTPFHVPSSFRVMLECQKFSSHANKIVHANLEGTSGVSGHIVQVLEDEWDIVQGMICSERAGDLDKFNALVVLLEIQIFYFMPPPGHSSDATKQNVLRTYQTAASVLRSAQELDQKIGFLAHITHYQVRSLLTAICVIFKLLRSSWMQFLDPKSIETTTLQAVSITQRMSVIEGDLPMRLAGLLRTFLDLYHSSVFNGTWHNEEPIVSDFPHRLGASVTLDCLKRWKADSTATRTLHQQQQQQHQQQQQQASNLPTDENALPSNVPESLGIDWSFMDDFDWTWTPSNLVNPVYFWQGMPR